MAKIIRDISSIKFFDISIRRVRSFIARVKLSLENDENFVKREPTPLLVHETSEEISSDLKQKLATLVKLFPKTKELKIPVDEICNGLFSSTGNGLLILNEYYKLLDLELKWLPEETRQGADSVEISASKDFVRFSFDAEVGGPGGTEWSDALSRQNTDGRFVARIAEINRDSRSSSKEKTIEQLAAIEAGYNSLAAGVALPFAFQGLGTSGFRDVQTCLSVADPGEGHINVTSLHADLLKGSIIHIEHIDRDKEANKEIVEPYRLPALRNAANVRLHFGADAPCTAFIGRPVFENHSVGGDPKFFDFDLLKTSHLIASACSSMFSTGVADCKIAIEKMTVTQAVTFMRAVVGNVIRDQDLQYLSAAFNINTTIVDDRGKRAKTISDPMETAKLGIEIAVAGGFEKVTWDGASDQIPSVPIIEQLSHSQIVELVHTAHEQGLETYISAGMKPPHMEPAAHTGVGGVGIGTSLHYRDPETNLMGALKPEAIREVLKFGQKGADSALGKSARLLARLDRMHFENLLSTRQEEQREKLYENLKNKKCDDCGDLFSSLVHVEALPVSDMHPLLAQASRLVTVANSNDFELDLPMEQFAEISSAIQTQDFGQIKSILKTQQQGNK